MGISVPAVRFRMPGDSAERGVGWHTRRQNQEDRKCERRTIRYSLRPPQPRDGSRHPMTGGGDCEHPNTAKLRAVAAEGGLR